MHHGLIKSLRGIDEETRVPKATIVEEARGLRLGDATRPGDIVILDFAEAGKHLIIDGVRGHHCLPQYNPFEGCGCAGVCGEVDGGQEVQDKYRLSQ